MTFFSWILTHKILVLLIAALTAFCISTIVLAVQNSDLKSQVHELDENNSNSSTTTTLGPNTPVNSTTSTPTTTTSPATTPDPSEDMSKYRLPTTTRPTIYDLYLYPDLETGLFKGSVKITLNLTNETDRVVLHSHLLTIDNVTVGGNAAVFAMDESYELLIITKSDGSKFTSSDSSMEINYNGDMKDRIVGLYTSTYTNSSGISTTIATSKFEPTYARQAFPCFDEPNMKAKYVVHLLKPKKENYIALSNYPVSKTESYDDSHDLVTFEETVSMSTYLTCFIVSDFIYTNTTFENNGTNVPLRVYASPENLEKTSYAGEVGKKVIEYYIKYFNIPYPLPKLDMVAIPDFVSGAMEHWGLVTYRETALLYTNTTHSSANKQRVATVVAHELAHSWFGNLVTMDWWNDLWLNEGFASYIEYKGVAAAEPEWEMMTQFLPSDLHSVLSLDAALSSHPIVQTVTTPDEITAIFDTISYNKGASILRMLENTVGEENFQKGVTNYLNKYAYSSAVTKNFLDEIQAVVGDTLDVVQMMDTYTVQMGYPVLNVTVSSDNTYVLTQKRFLKDPTATYNTTNVTYGYKWTVPITYVTNLGKSSELILFKYDNESLTLKMPEGANWLKLNYDQVGYYRVNYPVEIWETMASIYSDLSISDRTHLLEESFSIAEAGLLSYEIPLELTKRLVNETDYTPWSVAQSKLEGVLQYLSNSSHQTAFKEHVKNIANNAYKKLTWNESDEDSHLTRLTRVVVLSLSCSVGNEECLTEVQTKFNSWLETSTPLSQDLRSLVYKYGMKKGDEETWNKLLEIYKSESDANEKLKLVNGLANVENTTLLSKLLDLATDETIVRSQDYFTVVQYISGNSFGTSLVWDYVRNNWEALVARFTLNNRYLGSLIPAITKLFVTEERLAEMEAFFEKYPNAGAGASNRKTALETVKNNIRWLANYKTTVEDWLIKLNES